MISTFTPINPLLDLSQFSVTRPKFIITRQNAALIPGEIFELTEFAECRKPFPASCFINEGRSLCAETRTRTHWRTIQIEAVKAKAIQAIECQNGTSFLTFPKPHLLFSDVAMPHFHLNERLEGKLAFARKKALNSMAGVNAENEYDCSWELHKVGVGRMPLLAGVFGEAGAEEYDCSLDSSEQQQTGGVFLAHKLDTELLGHALQFVWHRINTTDVRIGLPRLDFGMSDHSLLSLTNNFLEGWRAVGKTHRLAITEAGVARHSSTSNNFSIHVRSGVVDQEDNDTCVRLGSLSPFMRGPQLLRDCASTLLKMTMHLTFCAYSADFLFLLEKKEIQPFLPYLQEFFGPFTSQSDITHCAERLRARYFKFMKTRESGGVLAGAVREWVYTQETGDQNHRNEQERILAFVFYPFLIDLGLELYSLCVQPTLQRRGFSLPFISYAHLENNLLRGVKDLRAELMKIWGHEEKVES